MGGDAPLVVRLEVTVPRIVLPQLHALHERRTHAGQLDRAGAGQEHVRGKDEEEGEQIRLLAQELTQLREQHPVIEATSRLIHTLRFRLLQATMPIQGRVFGLQILRWRNWFSHNETRAAARESDDSLFVADELTFSLEFLRPQEPSPAVSSAPVTPFTPGLNQIVIFLDHDGIPVSYSIDGAES
ncbi:MAG TPA: hypothetical protein VGN15_00675 [Ktedonobacteraceae bacterium]|nr:hypothetical protein [Ktedonobacteraceae bacterium]